MTGWSLKQIMTLLIVLITLVMLSHGLHLLNPEILHPRFLTTLRGLTIGGLIWIGLKKNKIDKLLLELHHIEWIRRFGDEA